MARKAFCSFHYVPDSHRASQVRNMGVIEGNRLVSSNRWEEIKEEGKDAIKNWIDGDLFGKSVVVAETNTSDLRVVGEREGGPEDLVGEYLATLSGLLDRGYAGVSCGACYLISANRSGA